MKTAIIKTSFWQEDDIFELNSDTRFFYLCLLTNPQRDITPAFKCGDRLLSAYTGYSSDLIAICRKQLIEKGKIDYVDGYYIFNEQDFVQPSKGRDTKVIFERYMEELPKSVKDFLRKKSTRRSTGTRTGTRTSVKDKDKDKDKEQAKAKFTKEGAEVLKLFESVDSQNKRYYSNTTQRKACDFLIAEYSFEAVRHVIENVLPQTNKRPRYEFPHISTPDQLVKNWIKVKDGIVTKKQEVETKKSAVAF